MEISINDIHCSKITDTINRLDKCVDNFIKLVNRNIPENFQLSNKCFFIERTNDHSYLDDGNTRCPGYDYHIYWSYSFGKTEQSKMNIENLTQSNSITFIYNCKERIYDHKKDSLYFFSLYFKGDSSDHKAERIDYINDNHNIFYLFRPYELMEVVYKVRQSLNLLPNNISEDTKEFEKFAKNFKSLKIDAKPHINLSLGSTPETDNSHFLSPVCKFAFLVNAYWLISVKRADLSDIQQASQGVYSIHLRNEFEKMTLEKFDSAIKSFIWNENSHRTVKDNEKSISFRMSDCYKAIYGYSYFNDGFLFHQGIHKNWHEKLLYFSYYLSKDKLVSKYTISMTSLEGRFRKNCIKVIEADTIDELLCSENAITVAKWLEEIFLKTYYINYYISVINNEKIEDFIDTKSVN